MRHVEHYVVEMRDPDTGYWVTQMRVAPAYEWAETVVPFLWFWSFKRRQIKNQAEALANARRRAIFQARTFAERRREDVRIYPVYTDDYGDWSGQVFWLNGQFQD